MSRKLDIQEFFIEGNDKKNSHVLLHITEPTTKEEQEKGYFFAIAEIEQGKKQQIKHVQKMIDDLESGYYESDQDFPEAFESTLKYINERTHQLLNYENSKLHCFAAAVKDGEISFAYHGQPQVFLFYNEKKGYQQINLTEEKNDQQNKIFPSVIEGKIQTGDTFYIGTPNINKLITENRLRKIVLNNNILEAAQDIQSSLTGFKPDLSFGGILFQLKNEQEKTEVIETSSDETNYRPTSEKTEEKISSDALAKTGKVLVKFFKGLAGYIWKLLIKIKDIFLGLFLIITNRGGQRKTVIRSIKQSFRDRRKEFSELPIISKALLIIALLAGLSFVGSLSYLKYQEAQKQEIKMTQNKIQQIQDNIESAQEELIYDNNQKALQILTTAQSKLEQLPKNLQSINSDFPNKNNLREKIKEKLRKARNITMVSSTLLAELPELKNKTYNKLAYVNDKLVGYNTSSKKISLVDKTTQNIEEKSYSSIENIKTDATPKENDYIVFGSKNKITKLNPDSFTFSLQNISFSNDKVDISGLATYSRNLYTLDKNNEQIYKHTPIQDGFGEGSPWLDSSVTTSFSNATSLAIDGNIYVLKENGEIEKFFKGKRENFEVSGVSPKLSQPTEIWTYRDVDNIYLLEPAKNRLIILDKEGNMVRQIKDKKWNNTTDMVIDEEKNQGYIIDQGKIYKFPLKLN